MSSTMPETKFSQKAEPHHRQEAAHLLYWHVRRDAENAEGDRRIEPRREPHADRVARQNCWKGEDRRRTANPVAERRRLHPSEKLQHRLRQREDEDIGRVVR